MANISAGVKLTSSSNSSPAEILLSGKNDVAGLLPILNPLTGAQMSGGVLVTVNPSAQTPGYTESLIQGQAMSLNLVFDSSGYFRFKLSLPNAYSLTSSPYQVNTEHTVAVSYDITSGQVNMSVDGSSQTSNTSFSSNPSSPILALSSFNGYIDQLLIFNSLQTTDALNTLTADPKSIVNSLSTTMVGSSIVPSHLETASIAAATTAYATGLLGQNTITTYADGKSNSQAVSTLGIQMGDSIVGLNIPSNATVSTITNNGMVYYTSMTGSVNSANFSNLLNKQVVAFVHPSSFSSSATSLSSGATLYVNSVSGIEIGDSVSGRNIPQSATVVAITGANSVTLSVPISTSYPVTIGTPVNFNHPSALNNLQVQTSSASSAGASTLNVYSVAGIQVGDIVTDALNILTPETVTGISGTTLTLSSPNVSAAGVPGSIPVNDTLTFTHSLSPTGTPTLAASTFPFISVTNNSGDATVYVSGSTGVLAGDYLSGPNIPLGDTVAAVGTDAAHPSLTLSIAPTAALSNGAKLVLTHPDSIILSGTVTSNLSTLSFTGPITVNSFTGVLALANDGVMVGDFVQGTNIPAGDKVLAVNNNSVVLSSSPTGVLAGSGSITFIHAADPNIQLLTISSTATSSNPSYAAGDVIQLTIPTADSGTTVVQYFVRTADLATGVNSASQTCANITNSILSQYPSVGVFNLVPGPVANTIELVPTQLATSSSGLYPLATVKTLANTNGLNILDENTITDYFNFSNLSGSSSVLGANGYNSSLGQAFIYNASGFVTSPVNSTTYNGGPISGLSTIVHGPVYAELASYQAPSTVTTKGQFNAGVSTLNVDSGAGIQIGDIITDISSSANNALLSNDTVLNVSGNTVTLAYPVSITSNDDLIFTHKNSTSTSLIHNNSTAFTLNSSAGIQVGDIVMDTINPLSTAGLRVKSVGLNSVTLSGTSTASDGDSLTFIHTGITETFNLYADPGYMTGSTMKAVGFTLNVPNSQAIITNVTPLLNGTLAQQNLTQDGTSSHATFQWASTQGVTDLSQPLAQVTLLTQSNDFNSPADPPQFDKFGTINATLTNVSINNSFFKTIGSSLPSEVTTNLPSQVYSLSGTIYSQFNNNATSPSTGFSIDPSKIPMPGTNMDYVVQGDPGSDIYLSLNTFASPFVAVTAQSPNANVNFDVLAQTASKGLYSMVIDLPNNASNVVFSPNAAFNITTNISNGHLLTITGQYTPPSNLSAAAVLGTINVTLNNELNTGSQFSIDSVITPTNSKGVGQSLYFGATQTNANGQYTIPNLPAGQISLYPFNNVNMAQSTSMSVNDALAAMSIAAGLGVPQGPGKPMGSFSNLLPSDFIAADWNKDGTVTAADALDILSYYVAVNKNPSLMSYTYLPASSNTTSSPESVSNVVCPTMTPFMTNLSMTSGSSLNPAQSQTLDIVGVLNGNLVPF